MLRIVALTGALLLGTSGPAPDPETPAPAQESLLDDADVVELIRLKLMVKYRDQIALAIKLDKRLPKDKRGHLEAVMYIIDLELLATIEELKINDPIAPLAIPHGQGDIS